MPVVMITVKYSMLTLTQTLNLKNPLLKPKPIKSVIKTRYETQT